MIMLTSIMKVGGAGNNPPLDEALLHQRMDRVKGWTRSDPRPCACGTKMEPLKNRHTAYVPSDFG